MTKLKKLLLTLAPISAVMIATPIILTSCSTNSETQNNGGGSGNGNGGGNGSGGGSDTGGGSGGSGNGGTTTNPSLTADATNSKEFTPTTDKGLFKTIESTIKAGAPGKEKEETEKAIAGYTNLKKEDVKDAIDVWSFNKWVGVTNSKVKYTSSIDKFVADKKETTRAKTTWDVSFTYKFKVVTTYDANKVEDIYAERTFEAKGVDLAAVKGVVDFTTKASLFMVDGKNMLEESPKLYDSKADANETQTIKDVKAFLNSANSKFDIRKVVNDFVTTKGFKGEAVAQKAGEWLDTISKPSGIVTVDATKKILTADLSKIESANPWYGLSKDTEQNAARNAVYTGNEKILTDTFKKLIFGNESMKKITANPAAEKTNLKFIITYDGKTSEQLTLLLTNVKGMK